MLETSDHAAPGGHCDVFGFSSQWSREAWEGCELSDRIQLPFSMGPLTSMLGIDLRWGRLEKGGWGGRPAA